MTTIIPKKPSTPGQPWSHLETTHLIDAYHSKWYSLNRGQLKAHQWEEVAASVAARCHHFPRPSKTGTQCRHKIEKLRKRYRSEKNRPVASLWPYFDRMDRMERGPHPVPVSVRPPPAPADSDETDEDQEEEEEEEEEDDDDDLLMELAREVRRFGEGMARVGKRRMEVMREVEREWMEMEAKRAEMVIECQRCIVESIAGAVKKAKKSQDL